MSQTAGLIDQTPPSQIAGLAIPAIGDRGTITNDRVIESEGLVTALSVDLGFTETLRVRKPQAGQLFAQGQLELISSRILANSANMLVVDCNLTPVQQRNLENTLQVKIVDRTGLILEIFGIRARSAEGRLQVEMARILYERSRLVRTWTHLERQRGGRGFLAGPGESQLEADRRMLDRRIAKLKADLADVRRTRGLQRAGRQKRGKPIIALVGYTNAGKSTLFNRLTEADVFAADMPFATLDPTVRDFSLHCGEVVSIVDTVGFITDLPTSLVESFRATVEEAIEADLLLHVRDISHEDSRRQAKDVETVLEQLERDTGQTRPTVIEVWNKSDKLTGDAEEKCRQVLSETSHAVMISASNGDGLEDLLEIIRLRLFDQFIQVDINIPVDNGKAYAWLGANSEVEKEDFSQNGMMTIAVRIKEVEISRFYALFPDVIISGWHKREAV